MLNRYRITLEYLGTNFKGWQKQKNNISLQETFENAAEKLLNQEINSTVAGRTDAGVHAIGQVIHIDIKKKIENSKLLMGLNFYLSKEKNGIDITVINVKKVSSKFHARFSAKKKHYQYKIFNANYRSPLFYSTTWWVRKKLDLEAMKLGINYFIGNNNYTSFRARGCQARSPVKTVNNAYITSSKNLIAINFFARSFLYNQVRIMVGTLKDIGVGRIKYTDLKKIISKRNRADAGVTAPAKGLTLIKVFYR